MNAQAQRDSYPQPFPIFRELDATRAISREASCATAASVGVESIAALVLRVGGVRAVHISGTQRSDAFQELGLADFNRANGAAPVGTPASAIAPIASRRYIWGELRIEFDIPAFDFESPVRFATFIGQQMAGMLLRIHLAERGRALAQMVDRLRRVLTTRKAVHRAAGILARAYDLSEKEAIGLLIRQSRDASRPVGGIAEQIISSHRVVAGVDEGYERSTSPQQPGPKCPRPSSSPQESRWAGRAARPNGSPRLQPGSATLVQRSSRRDLRYGEARA